IATSSNVQINEPADVSYIGLTFSPDGNYIYYLKVEKGKNIRTLYQVPVLGGASRKILDNIDSSITFSPDGNQFAFTRNQPSKGEMILLIVNSDGTGEKEIAVRKQPNILLEPSWSP